MKIYWQYSSAIELGVESIDNQHKALMEKANQLNQQIVSQDKEKNSSEAARFLAQYIIEHISEEEAFMREIDYPQYQQHQKMHEAFIRKIESQLKLYDAEAPGEADFFKLSMLFNDWIVEHIQYADRALAQYYKQQQR